MKMRLRDRLIKGSIFNFLAIAFNQGSTLLINILVARILLKAGYGEYSMIYSTLVTSSALTQLATGSTAAKYVAEFRTINPLRTGNIIGLCYTLSILLGTFFSLSIFFLGNTLACEVLAAPHLVFSLKLGSIFLFFSSLNGYQTGVLAGFEAFSKLAKAGSLSGCINLLSVVFGAWFSGLNGAIMGLGLGSICRFLMHRHFLKLQLRIWNIRIQPLDGLTNEKSILLKFSIPSAFSGSFSMIISWYVIAFLARQSNGFSEVSLYSASANFKMLVVFVPMVINSVSTSLINHSRGLGEQASYDKIFSTNLIANFSITALAALTLSIFGNQALEVFGKDFTDGKMTLNLLLMASLFEVVGTCIYQHIYAQGKLWLSFFAIILPRDLTLLFSARYFIPKHGAAGLGAATCLSFFIALTTISLLKLYLSRASKSEIQ
jgi:O-antigen/teichoic acid export membrane protein